jgi:hypothetical protein
MLLVLLLFVIVVWLLTARDVLRRRLSGTGRFAWLAATLLLPFVAIPAYWAVRPLPRTPSGARGSAGSGQTLADFIPGWAPDSADACEQADSWARSSHAKPAPTFYTWLRESGLADKYPACAAKLVRTLLGAERRTTFGACPEIGALTALLERHVGEAEDVRAIREQLLRLCPGSAPGRAATLTGASTAA